jgi:hypothetical protein
MRFSMDFDIRLAMCSVLACLAACGGDGDKPTDLAAACTPKTSEECERESVCELEDGEPRCVAPVVVRGRVLNLANGVPVSGARVVVLSSDGSARAPAVVTGSEGDYQIAVPVDRKQGGEPVEASVSLRVDAAGYQSFPMAPREPVALEMSEATASGADPAGKAPLVVSGDATIITLSPLPGDSSALSTLSGTLRHELAAGALVLANQQARSVATAVADAEGNFTLFNVPAGATHVEAYRAGVGFPGVDVTAPSGDHMDGIDLTGSVAGLGSVEGRLEIVNAEGNLATTVILVADSTFEQVPPFSRGFAPAGLRAANVTSAFSIDAVPPGFYAVVPAFENDYVGRDPARSMAGMDTEFIQVDQNGDVRGVAGPAPELQLYITSALAVASPGAMQFEHLSARDAVEFAWAADPAADGYELRVFDTFGTVVRQALDIPAGADSQRGQYTVQGLAPGAVYQFRVVSFRQSDDMTSREYLHATEDLRGAFQIDPP